MKYLLVLTTLLASTVAFGRSCEPEIKQFQKLTDLKSKLEVKVTSDLTDILAELEVLQKENNALKIKLNRLPMNMTSGRQKKLVAALDKNQARMMTVSLQKAALEKRMTQTYQAFYAAQLIKNQCLSGLSS